MHLPSVLECAAQSYYRVCTHAVSLHFLDLDASLSQFFLSYQPLFNSCMGSATVYSIFIIRTCLLIFITHRFSVSASFSYSSYPSLFSQRSYYSPMFPSS
ncbi:hypothetical protein FA13DRAFT_1239554 [Coprinellus micaceus]|uniref:Uncharacterized protein n=1 Tax=Coprinellus micaceus TaxID=71717 RepID=A0A4Y7TPW4_COPMI|nr:hypothetical protein FA13DRAFT_1239554 [Coprinellus micaceus]